MKFYLTLLVFFGLFIAGAREFPRLAAWVRSRDLEGRAKERIVAAVKDPATIRWNDKRVAETDKTTVLTFDITADMIQGGMAREVWTFEFDSESKALMSVQEGAGPRLQWPDLLPVK